MQQHRSIDVGDATLECTLCGSGAPVVLLELPPYSPELNPVERIWHYLRSHWLANSVFSSLADIRDACETAWNRFANNHGLVRSLCAVAWVPAPLPL